MTSSIDLHFPQLTDLLKPWPRGIHAESVPPHITLLHPWRHPIADTDLRLVSAIAGRHDPFAVTFTDVAIFESGFVYLKPAPHNTLTQLIAGVMETFPDTPPYGGAVASPVPHLTVGAAEPITRLRDLHTEIAESLGPHLPLVEPVHALSVMEERPDGRWRTVADFGLGDTSQ